jgi:hypothetical protein
MSEILAVHELHRNERLAFVVLINVFHPHHVWVHKLPCSERFLFEALGKPGVAHQFAIQQFQGPQLLKTQVHCLVDGTHASLAHLAQNAIFPANNCSFSPFAETDKGISV